MKKEKITTTPKGQPAAKKHTGNVPSDDAPYVFVPDDRPRRDGPGGEDGE